MDLYTKVFSIMVIILIALTIAFDLSGCAMCQRVTSAIFDKPDVKLIITPETSKQQLWQTIKGLTPNWLAIPVIALGAVAMFNGAAKLGMSCVIFGSVNLFMALATSRFGFWMALCGLVGSCAAVAASMLAKNKTVKDLIYGIQGLKDEVIADMHMPRAKEIIAKQTKSTRKIVQKIKSKAKLRGDF